jgi:hypothetical protein
MPFLLFILVVLLVAQVGFWKALGAIVGALAMFGLLFVLGIAILVLGGMWIAGRLTRRSDGDDWR